MIFITITTIIENTIFLLTALDAVTHLAEGLALARCRASDTERSVGARQLIAEVTWRRKLKAREFIDFIVSYFDVLLSMNISDE